MTIQESAVVAQAEWSKSRIKTKRVAQVSGLMGIVLTAVIGLPAAYLAAGVILLIAGVFASVRPALRSASADPAAVLRAE